jgi:hypothetical protein
LGEGDEEAGEAGVEKPRLAVRTFNRAAGGGGLTGEGGHPGSVRLFSVSQARLMAWLGPAVLVALLSWSVYPHKGTGKPINPPLFITNSRFALCPFSFGV